MNIFVWNMINWLSRISHELFCFCVFGYMNHRDPITFWEWYWNLNIMRFGVDWTSQSLSENMTRCLGICIYVYIIHLHLHIHTDIHLCVSSSTSSTTWTIFRGVFPFAVKGASGTTSSRSALGWNSVCRSFPDETCESSYRRWGPGSQLEVELWGLCI